MKLIDLTKGQCARILAVPLPRMKELGLIPGTQIVLLSPSSLGSPIEISFGGCDLLIDCKTAARTEVEPCD